jgi:hypothetical protein
MTMTICKVEKTFGMWFSGMIAGWPRDEAERLQALGVVTILPPAPSEGEVGAEPSPKSEVEIPEDWAGLHHMSLIALAKKIAGGAAPEITSREAANPIIEAELARRAETKE